MKNQTNHKITLLLTGASGFIGRHLSRELFDQENYHLRIAVRGLQADTVTHFHERFIVDDISEFTCWNPCLKNCNVVIHAAARVHVLDDHSMEALLEYRKINVDGTMQLARQAAQQGVKRFIFLSSIHVNGQLSPSSQAFRPDDIPAPQDPYAISKVEAEQQLQALAIETGMEIVIIRPAIVYGPGMKGNFPRLITLLQKGYPLPLKAVKNKRSFVSIYNLVSLITRCIDHPNAANNIFLVSDGKDISIKELLKNLADVMHTKARLFSLPYSMLNYAGILTGKQRLIQRLCGSLQVDISKTCNLLDWKPEVNMCEALKLTIEDSK